jgi:hypothetical protein
MAYSNARLKISSYKASTYFRPLETCLHIRTLLYVPFKHNLIILSNFMCAAISVRICAKLPYSQIHKFSCCLGIADLLSRCIPIFPPLSDECRKSDQ